MTGITAPPGYEIIPSEVLDDLTPEKIDWERNRIVDDRGILWTDLQVLQVDLDQLLDGGRGPVRLCGKRAAS